MRIAIVSGTFPPMRCGVGDYVAELAKALAEHDHDVHVVTSRDAATHSPGITIHPVVDKWTVRGVGPVRTTLSRLRPDAINLQYPTAAYGWRLGAPWLSLSVNAAWRRAATARTITVHEYHDTNLLGRLGVLLTAWTFPTVLTTNEATLSLLDHRLRATMSLIPIGSNITPQDLPAEETAQSRRRIAGGHSHLISYFGYISPSKGVDRLLDAMALMPQDVRLVIATALDPVDGYHRFLRNKADRLGDRVVWTGYIASREVSELLQVSDALVLPFDVAATTRRGSVVAGMVHGIPVVTTGPVTRPLADGINCIALRDTGPEEIARAVSLVLSDDALAVRLRAGATSLAPSFDWGRIARAYEQAFVGEDQLRRVSTV